MVEHSVSSHLHVDSAGYDWRIRQLVPAYDAMRRKQLAVLGRALWSAIGQAPVVLNLGGGTGALAAAVATQFPAMRAQLWDIDYGMLAVEKARCADFDGRVTCVEQSFLEPLPPCAAVVGCISLHRVKDLRPRRKSTSTSSPRCDRAGSS